MGKIIQNYSLQEMLGQGVYGKVFRGINIKTKEEVAVKVIKTEKFRAIPKLEECTLNEINTLLKIEEKDHIVHYIDMLKTVNNFYFVYEYCNGGTLEKAMQAYRNTPEKVMPESKTITYFSQIVDAFRVLTKYNIMHRDLKPDNILLHNGVIKIADFGFCKSLASPQDLAQTMLGSPIYMAPEVLKGEIYTMKADIWSLGVVLYEMLNGECPYKSNSIAKLIQVLESSDAVFPKTSNPNLQKLLRRMLVKDPNKRIEWSELFNFKLTADEPDSKNSSSTFTTTSNNSLTYTVGKDLSATSANNGKPNYLRNTTKNVQASWQQQQDALSQDGPRKRSPHRSDTDQSSNPSNNYSLRSTLTTTSPQINYVSRSPMVDTKSFTNQAAVDHFLSSHRKVSQIVRLSLDVCEKPNKYAAIVSYILTKAAEKELIDLSSSLKKEIDKPTCNSMEQSKFREFKKVTDKQIDEMQPLANCYRQQILRGPEGDKFNSVLNNRNRFLKAYIQGLKLDCDDSVDSFVHVSQLLDYFEESLILKKDAYQRLTKEQLNRQINSKLIKL